MIRKLKAIAKVLITPEEELFQPALPQRYLDEVAFLKDPLNEKEINYSVNISLQHNYLYVATPKAACSSVKTSLQRLEMKNKHLIKGESLVHERLLSPLLTPSQIQGLEDFVKSDDIYKFCFVRNPYSRTLSAYLDKIARPSELNVIFFKALGKNSKNFGQHISFEDFLKAVKKISPEKKDAHWREQHHQVMYSKIDYDFIGYFENVESDLKSVLENITPGGSSYYAKTNYHATNASERLHEYYTQDGLEILNSIYAKDFEIFGYKMFEKLPASPEEWKSGLVSKEPSTPLA